MKFTEPTLAEFPSALRRLVDEELAAGNRVVEIARCFPAPPAGAYVKLEQPVRTREKRSSAEVRYYDRNGSQYSGEWADERRFFFVLEPPRAPEPEMDPNARREALRQASVEAGGVAAAPAVRPNHHEPPPGGAAVSRSVAVTSLVQQFQASMNIDYEKWHDGIGYDLALLGRATVEEREQIESLVLQRGARDWRDVEALGALATSRAQAALREAFVTGDAEIRSAVARVAPGLVSDEERIAHLVAGVRTAEVYHGLTAVLAAVEHVHPPAVQQALIRGALEREGEVAYHLAAMLLHLHGQLESRYDWSERPFLLRFNTSDTAAREMVFRELCARIGVDPREYL